MSLRDSYFNGPSGLNSQMDAAFAAGIAYIGAGASDVSTLSLGDRNGTNLTAGSGMPGFYFTYSSPTVLYAMWIYVNGELPPVVSNATLVQVTVLGSDTSTGVTAKIATAMNNIAGDPFSVIASANVLTMSNNATGVALFPASVGTLGGTSAAAQVSAGVMATGNFATLQSALMAAAAQGQLEFRVLITGTGSANATYLRSRNGHNLYLSSFFSGIMYALAGQEIYDYQVELTLDISTTSSTNVIFSFNFGNSRRRERVNLEPLACNSYNPQNSGYNGGVLPI